MYTPIFPSLPRFSSPVLVAWLAAGITLPACGADDDDQETAAETGDGESETGDGESETGDGDGDGDPGDGDGETETGDGDGEPEPLGSFELLDMAEATAVSANGEYVVLFDGFTSDGQTGIWSEAEGLRKIDPSGHLYHYPWAISDDGKRVAGATGTVLEESHPAMWNEGVGWEPLGELPGGSCGSHGHAWDMTPDGDTIVGLAWDGCVATGFRWTEADGFAPLDLLGQGSNRASAVSDDGQRIAGFGDAGLFINRTPATWAADGTGEFILDEVGEVRAMSGDGKTIAGEYNYGQAFVWREGEPMIDIGKIPEGETTAATVLAVCAQGDYVVGHTGLQGPMAGDAFVWTEARGMELLEDRLRGLGVDIPEQVDKIFSALDCSNDGQRVVGATVIGTPNGKLYQAYALTLPEGWWTLP